MKNKKKKAILILIPILVFVILGSVVIYISYKTGKNDANKISASVNSTNIDIKTCGNPIYTYGKKKIYSCLENYIIRKGNNNKNSARAMQNFAVTKDYVYFSTAFDLDDTVEGTGRTYVVRVDRKTGVKKQMFVNYAGHAQSFDAVTNSVKKTMDSNIKVDQLFMNGFSNDLNKKGTFRGVYYTTFGSNKKGERHQANSVSIKGKTVGEGKDKKTVSLMFGRVQSADYKTNGIFDADSFNDALKEIANDKSYMTNPELAVSPDGKTIAFAKTIDAGFDGGNAEIYVYSMKEFKRRPKKKNENEVIGDNILYRYDVEYKGNKQGVEIDDKYLYIWSEYKDEEEENGGDGEHYISLYKYNLKTGKQVGGTKLTKKYLTGLTNRLTRIAKKQNKKFVNEKGYNSFEAEGMSVYDGKIYVGIVYRSTYEDSKLPSINNIYMIDGV